MRNFWLIISLFFIYTCGGGSSSPTEPEPPQPPTVANLDLETAEDTSLNFTLQGTEPSGLSLTYAFSSNPSNGQVTLNGAQATYNPNANYNGTDTFGYIATSTSGSSTAGVISITITPVDDEPSTMDANATTDEDNAVDISLEAEEYDGDDIEFQVKNNPSYGSVSISGTIATYTPNQDWNGTDTFNFEAVDSSAKRILNTATATIIVNPVNDAPTVENVTAQMDENKVAGRYQPVTITLVGTDVDGDNLSYAIVNNPSNGTLQSDGTATVIYTPNQDYNGEDTFTYKANDGTVDSDNNATVTVTINSVNDKPTVENIEDLTAIVGQILQITLIGSDVDGDSLTFNVNNPTLGTILSVEGNILTYQATKDGEESFTYTANDGIEDSDPATVTIQINKYQNFAGGTGEEWGRKIHQTPDGGYLIFGSSNSTTTIYNDPASNGGHDFYLVKATSSGEIEWEKFIGSSSDEKLYHMVPTNDGGYLLGGEVSNDVYLTKIDQDGNQIWENAYGSSGNDKIYNLKSTSDNYFVLMGSKDGEHWALKIDSNGSEVKEIVDGGDGNDYLTDMVELSDGSYVFSGMDWNSATGERDFYLVKWDSSFSTKQWQTFNDYGVNDVTFNGLELRDDESFILIGRSEGSSGTYYTVALTFSSSGEFMGRSFWNYYEDSYANGLLKTSDGRYIVYGYVDTDDGNTRGFYEEIDADVDGDEIYNSVTNSYWWGATGSENFGAESNNRWLVNEIIETSEGGFIAVGSTDYFRFADGDYDAMWFKLEDDLTYRLPNNFKVNYLKSSQD